MVLWKSSGVRAFVSAYQVREHIRISCTRKMFFSQAQGLFLQCQHCRKVFPLWAVFGFIQQKNRKKKKKLRNKIGFSTKLRNTAFSSEIYFLFLVHCFFIHNSFFLFLVRDSVLSLFWFLLFSFFLFRNKSFCSSLFFKTTRMNN